VTVWEKGSHGSKKRGQGQEAGWGNRSCKKIRWNKRGNNKRVIDLKVRRKGTGLLEQVGKGEKTVKRTNL